MPARWALPSYYLKTKKGKVTFLVLRYHARTFGFPCFPHTASFRDFRPETNAALPFPAHTPDPAPFPASGFTAIPEYEAGHLLQEQRTLFRKSVIFETMLQPLTVNSDQLQKLSGLLKRPQRFLVFPSGWKTGSPVHPGTEGKFLSPCTFPLPHGKYSIRSPSSVQDFSGIGIGQPFPPVIVPAAALPCRI